MKSVALALLFLGKQDESDATIETLKAIDHPISKQAQVLVDMCSYAGTGNVLKVQTMLHYCTERSIPDANGSDDAEGGDNSDNGASGGSGSGSGDAEADSSDASQDKEANELFQAFAVIGIALVTMGEEVGAEMALRHLSHLMHYGEPTIRRAVPLSSLAKGPRPGP